jgi:hypothetical protein
LTKKLSFFLREFIIFEPKSNDEAIFECARHVDAGAANFTVTEMSIF